jgi:ParB/RepB/Spo0J family partition protein
MELEFHQLDLPYERLRIWEPRRQARLVATLAEQGQQVPVLVIAAAHGNAPSSPCERFVLIDGYRRVRALRTLGRDTVQALVLPLGEVEALILTHRLERAASRSALEQGWFLHELHASHRLSLRALAEQCGHSSSWISRRLALVRALPDAVQDAVRSGVVCPHAAMRVLVPLARANTEQCKRLVEAVASQAKPLTSRQWQRLHEAWRAADPETRERIVAQPLVVLRVDEELARSDPPTPRVPPAPQALLRDLETLAAIGRRARRTLAGEDTGAWQPRTRAAIDGAWSETHAAFTRLETWFGETRDAQH